LIIVCNREKNCVFCGGKYVGACVLAVRMCTGSVHVYWQCACVLAVRMCTGSAHVYWQCACVLAVCMCTGSVHVYWQCACQAGDDLVIKGVNNENITVNHFAEN